MSVSSKPKIKHIAIFLLILTIPILSQSKIDNGIFMISEFIASEKFSEISDSLSDDELIDLVYLKAVDYFDSNYSDALLALSFAFLPFNKMPLQIPLFGIHVNVPLPSVKDSIFILKINNLPKILFFDSPQGAFGDKDKTAHFFGNAFLSYNLGFSNIPEFSGIFVELFESSFKVSGGLDARDLTANKLGETFGEALKRNRQVLPSHVLNLYLLTQLKIIR